MAAIWFDSTLDDAKRRDRLYSGDIFVFSPRARTRDFCDFARSLIEDAFAPDNPREAQHHMAVEAFVDIVAPLKPRFIHHPETKRLIQRILEDCGCDMDRTYFDVPRMRVVSSDAYLTAGVGHQLDAHRDTWWAAPMCQLNWWSPVYEFEHDSAMTFLPQYWDRRAENSSRKFNYYEHNAVGRKEAAQHISSEKRNLPELLEQVEWEAQLRLVVPVGGLILFSGAHMHATVPNTSGRTRFSLDFRTVNRDDLLAGRAPPNVDAEPGGSSLRDFMRGTDLTPLPEDEVAPHDTEVPPGGVRVFHPEE